MMRRAASAGALIVVVAATAALLAACATTSQGSQPVPETWRAGQGGAAAPPAGTGGRITVYVASFGLSRTVAEHYPELAASQVGWGIANRVVEALYDSRRFDFREEKAEIAKRIAGLIRKTRPPADDAGADDAAPEGADDPPPDDVRFLLYGEVVDVHTERREKVVGLVGRAETVTHLTIQLRLLDRSTRRFIPATATGSHAAPAAGREDELDEISVGNATDEAVRGAAAELLRLLATSAGSSAGAGEPRPRR